MATHIKNEFLSGLGIGSDEDAKNFFEHPINTLMNSFSGQGELAIKAKDAYQRGDYTNAVIHGLNYLVPFIGQQTDKAGEQIQKGDIAGGLARTVGVGTGIAAADTGTNALRPQTPAPAGFTPTPTPTPSVKAVVTAPVRYAARSAESAINQKLLPAKPLLRIMTPADEAEAVHVKVPGRDYGLRPKAEVPETPPAAQPAAQPAAAASPETAATADTSPKNVERLLGEATGAKPLQPKVALRKQATATATKTASLPDDFTPVKSSALQGYKYDPQTQELTSITNNGQTYKHSGVTPDMMAAFEEAKSKGQAWNMVRKGPGVTLIEKNGTPVVKSSYRSASPEDATPGDVDRPSPKPASVPASPKAASRTAAETPTSTNAKSGAAGSPDEDLTALLNESLKQVQRTKSGVEHVSADPAKLVEEWGVDEDSLKNTREQTRGMSPEETEAYTQKLADAYKKGFPVEPLLETRDQYGNILEVDGRQRAIAAQRAGIKQVPVMRRYLKK